MNKNVTITDIWNMMNNNKESIGLNKNLAKLIGDRESIFLFELIKYNKKLIDSKAINYNEYFNITHNYFKIIWGYNTAMCTSKLKRLELLKLINIKKIELPCKNYYYLNIDEIIKLFICQS